MPEVLVLTRRPSNPRGLVFIGQKGEVWNFPVSPSKWEYRDVQRWGQIEREGHKPISRPRGGGLRSLSFSVLVAALDYKVSVESAVATLTAIGARGNVVRIKGGSPTYQGPCWWYVQDCSLTAQRLTPEGLITQGVVTFNLEEYVEGPDSVVKPPPPPSPPPPPVRRPSPEPVREPIYRYHTVVAGDWLSTLAARYLGNMARWPEIYNLNRTLIGPNPNLLRTGLRLRIPPR